MTRHTLRQVFLLGAFALAASAQTLSFRRTDIATATGPQGVATGDFNGDSIIDIAVLDSSASSTSILIGNGDGTFAAPLHTSLGSYPRSFALGDFNSDGKLDLIANDVNNNRISVMRGKGDGTFQSSLFQDICCGALAIGDLDNNGKLDLIIASGTGVNVALGKGDGTFFTPTFVPIPSANQIAQIAISDLNADGKLDIVTVNFFSNNISVLLGNGDGSFQAPAYYAGNPAAYNATSVAIGDLNGDGKPDVVIGDSNGTEIYFGSGGGVFQNFAPVALAPYTKGVAVADITGDGRPDIIAVTDQGTPTTAWMWVVAGNGNGTFGAPVSFATGQGPTAVALADLNRDGRLDAVTANQVASGVSVFITIGRTAVSALRDYSGSIQMVVFPSGALKTAGGLFASDPEVAEDANGNVNATARDNFNSLWVNVFRSNSQTWAGWSYGAGVFQAVSAITVAPNGTAWITARDTYNSYWLNSYSTGGGWGTWLPLYGVFSTDPVITSCADGSVYIVGKDTYNSMWSGRYIPGTGFQNWQFGGGIIQGKPSITCGSDNAVYMVARDMYNSHWMARIAGNTWTGWFFGGALDNADPKIAALGGSVAVVILDPTNVVWRTSFTEGTGNGWQAWTQVGGVLQDYSPAVVNGELYFAGRAPNNDLWWWRQTGNQWTWIGNNGVAAGALAAAPR